MPKKRGEMRGCRAACDGADSGVRGLFQMIGRVDAVEVAEVACEIGAGPVRRRRRTTTGLLCILPSQVVAETRGSRARRRPNEARLEDGLARCLDSRCRCGIVDRETLGEERPVVIQ